MEFIMKDEEECYDSENFTLPGDSRSGLSPPELLQSLQDFRTFSDIWDEYPQSPTNHSNHICAIMLSYTKTKQQEFKFITDISCKWSTAPSKADGANQTPFPEESHIACKPSLQPCPQIMSYTSISRSSSFDAPSKHNLSSLRSSKFRRIAPAPSSEEQLFHIRFNESGISSEAKPLPSANLGLLAGIKD